MMETYQKRFYSRSFDSILEVANHIDDNMHHVPMQGHAHSMDSAMKYDAAMHVARNGGYFPQGAKDIKAVELNLNDFDMHALSLPQPINSVVGHRPDVAAYMANSPMSMIKFTQHPQPNRLIKIFVNVCKTWDISDTVSLNRGNGILSVINALDAAGYSTEIWAGMRTGHRKHSISMDVCIKQSTAHYSLDSIAFALANDGFLRRVLFSAFHIAVATGNHDQTEAIQKIDRNSWGFRQGLTYPDYDLFFDYLDASSGRWTKENSIQKVIDITKDQLANKLGDAA